jgi:hypothetical protein
MSSPMDPNPYAPPRANEPVAEAGPAQPPDETSAPPPPEGVFAAIRAAAGLWRAHPGSMLLVWGIVGLPLVLPWHLLFEGSDAGARPTATKALLTVVQTLIWAASLAGQARFTLVACRGARPAARDFLQGLRSSGRALAFWLIAPAPMMWVNFVAPISEQTPGWRIVLTFAIIFADAYVLVRLAMMPVRIVDLPGTLLDAVSDAWSLTKGQVWRTIGLGTLWCAIWVLIYAATGRSATVAGVVFNLTAVPLAGIAYVFMYRGYLRRAQR